MKGGEGMENLIIETHDKLYLDKHQFLRMFDIDVEGNGLNFIDTKTKLDHTDLIEIATKLSFTEPDELERNLKLLDIAKIMMGNVENTFMFTSLNMMVIKIFLDSRQTEFDIHKLFKSKYKKVLGEDYKIIKRKNNPKHIPDFWLMSNKEYIPVEIKLHEFNANHLKQLQRYINFYECSKGLAVAKELKCPLPSNIKFVNYENLQEA